MDLGVLDAGGFCKVFKVISRLDGSQYAVKRTERKLQSERERREALREVQAMAGLDEARTAAANTSCASPGCWMSTTTCTSSSSCATPRSARRSRRASRRARESMDAETSAGDVPEEPRGDGAKTKTKTKTFGQKEIEKVLRHVASALAFAHARNVAHLDVKPDNVLVRDGVYKLADWGRAAPVDGVGYVGEPSAAGAKKQRLVSKPSPWRRATRDRL